MRRGLWSLALALIAGTGCAVVPPAAPPGSGPRTTPTATRDTTAAPTPRQPAAPVAAAIDSAPSPEALQVLATLPEPLRPEERVPSGQPAADFTNGTRAATPSAPAERDTAGTSVERESPLGSEPDSVEVESRQDSLGDLPIPKPTLALGERDPNAPPPQPPPPDTSRVPAPAGPQAAPQPAPPKPAPPSGPPPGAPRETAECWRVQIAAPVEEREADLKRGAGESLLLTPFVIERDRKLYKVRSKPCFDRAGADRLKERAEASGFRGAFVFKNP